MVNVEQIKLRSQAAQRLLDDPLVMEILANLENEHVERWRNAESISEREIAWHDLRAVHNFRARLVEVAHDYEVTRFNHKSRDM